MQSCVQLYGDIIDNPSTKHFNTYSELFKEFLSHETILSAGVYDELFFYIVLGIFKSCIKHESWKSEREFRVIGYLDDTNVQKAKPDSIFVGINCDELYKNLLLEIGKELQVSVYQMKFDDVSTNFGFKKETLFDAEV